jgi:hypothetical protein
MAELLDDTRAGRAPAFPRDPDRVRAFAHFFKRYMSVSSVVAAALPVPVTAIGLIPTFSEQTGYLSTYTSMFCFLCLGFVFYSRHQLAPRMFARLGPGRETGSDYGFESRWGRRIMSAARRFARNAAAATGRTFVPILPFLLIVTSFYCSLAYHRTLSDALRMLGGDGPTADVLKDTPFHLIPFATELELYYIAMFVAAESAFILMAIKEYLQDLVGLTDRMILGLDRLPEGFNRGSSSGPVEYSYGATAPTAAIAATDARGDRSAPDV